MIELDSPQWYDEDWELQRFDLDLKHLILKATILLVELLFCWTDYSGIKMKNTTKLNLNNKREENKAK